MDSADKSLTKVTKLTVGEAEKDEEVPPLVAASEDVKPAKYCASVDCEEIKRCRSPPGQNHLRELGNVE